MKNLPTLLLILVLCVMAAGCATTRGGKVAVQGTVVTQGSDVPVPDANVNVSVIDDPARILATALTDRRGKFALSLRPGPYTVWVSKDGYFENSINASFDQPNNRVDISLDQHNQLSGTLTEPDGSPAYPVVIELKHEQSQAVFSGAAAPDGNYLVKNLPTGDYTITARSPDGKFIRRGEKRISGGGVQLNIQLEVNIEQEKPAVMDLPMKAIGEGGGEIAIK